jgi:hypothetical protein
VLPAKHRQQGQNQDLASKIKAIEVGIEVERKDLCGHDAMIIKA